MEGYGRSAVIPPAKEEALSYRQGFFLAYKDLP